MITTDGRGVVQPIRSKIELENCITYLKRKMSDANTDTKKFLTKRNYMLFLVGINTALRISDLLKLKASDVDNGYVNIREQKTGKNNQIFLNKELHRMLVKYIKDFEILEEDYLFTSQKGVNKPITTTQAYRVIRQIAKALKLKYPIGTHSLRKTYGYHYYKKTKNIAALMKMLNHTKESTTLIYIGMLQGEVDKERQSFQLGF